MRSEAILQICLLKLPPYSDELKERKSANCLFHHTQNCRCHKKTKKQIRCGSTCTNGRFDNNETLCVVLAQCVKKSDSITSQKQYLFCSVACVLNYLAATIIPYFE